MQNINSLARKISLRTDLKISESEELVKIVFDEIQKSLIEDKEEVRIKNFGAFKFGVVPGKVTYHPTTGEKIKIDEKITVRLSLATKFKRDLRRGN